MDFGGVYEKLSLRLNSVRLSLFSLGILICKVILLFKFFTDCACAAPPPTRNTSDPASHGDGSLVVTQGACPMECSVPFYIFLALMAVNKFIGATGRTSGLLISVR